MDRGIIIDVETTGLNPHNDEIIEVGVLEFVRGDFPSQVQIASIYSGLQQPSKNLSNEISNLTGLNDEILAGRRIDWQLVARMLSEASIVIAHNAEFDVQFLLRVPEIRDLTLNWACSLRHIDWEGKGFKTKKLTYLAADNGFVNPFPHRAVFDCATTLRIISPHIDELVQNSYQREYRVAAVQAPFEAKDLLKARGYQWDVNQRFWSKILPESRMDEERRFLAAEVYRNRENCHMEQILPPLGAISQDPL